jgi:hypothetical protein
MKLITTYTVGAGGSSFIGLDNIPQTYTDLLIVASTRNSQSSGDFQTYLTINGTGGSGSTITSRYLRVRDVGLGSYTVNNNAAIFEMNYQNSSYTANTFSALEIYLPNYANNLVKTFSVDSASENNSSSHDFRIIASNLTLTAAITSVQIIAANGSLVENSSVSLYGITKGSGGATVS